MMYEQFYGLIEKPFGVTPDPRFLYLSPQHREALAYLQYGLRERIGFVAITGEVGTGKTTLLHALLNGLDASTRTAFVFNTALTAKGLFRMMAADFGIKTSARTKTELLLDLHKFLLRQYTQGIQCVLVIDEAQNLNYRLLEEIRMLSNLETDREKLLQIIIVGQPELASKLAMPRLRQLRQRINTRYQIGPLNAEECVQYIAHRLRVAGISQDGPFCREAITEIYRWTNGIPRLINMVCDRALVLGYARECQRIDLSLIRATVTGLAAQGVLPEPPESSLPQRQLASIAKRKGSWPRRTIRHMLAATGLLTAAILFSLPLNMGESNSELQDAMLLSMGMNGTSSWLSVMNDSSCALPDWPAEDGRGEIESGALSHQGDGRPGGLYSVHVASFRDLSRAERLAQALTENRFQPIFIMPVELTESGRWYRVMVGWYDDQQSALEAAREYIADGTFHFAQTSPLEGLAGDDRTAGMLTGEWTSSEGVRDE